MSWIEFYNKYVSDLEFRKERLSTAREIGRGYQPNIDKKSSKFAIVYEFIVDGSEHPIRIRHNIDGTFTGL